MTGLATGKEWYVDERPVDFYDIKGSLEVLLEALGFSACTFKKEGTPPWYRSGSAAKVLSGEIVLGTVGELSPQVLKKFGIDDARAYVLELDGTAMLDHLDRSRAFIPLTKFPAVLRDVSLVVKRDIEGAAIREIIEREGGELVESVNLFDLYEGGKIAPSEKALAFRIRYRSKEGTLDGRDINRLHERIVEQVGKETGARLRES